MRRLTGAAAIAVAVTGAMAFADPPPGFTYTLTTDAATGGKLKVSADGKLVYPANYDVISAELKFTPQPGEKAPETVLIATYGDGKWSVKDAAVNLAGKYDVYAVFKFRKKNPQPGVDLAFDVASAPRTDVVITGGGDDVPDDGSENLPGGGDPGN